ncbi:MAG: ABC transporter ATP-binding protein [Desulfobacteraceae bacterium]|nr:MAG: ABC transporter ATP-binding protein [Desulfobacteraceae bacterium]
MPTIISNHEPLLKVSGLKTYFFTFEGLAKAVDGVDFEIGRGETVGVVGESGCGKSVSALSILRLIADPPGKIVGGRILFNAIDLLKIAPEEMRAVRGNKISMIFQEPMTSLNPVFTVGDQIAEAVMLHQKVSRKEAWEKAVEMLRLVQISEAENRVHEHPHKMSGGMRQRAMIAMALSCRPQLLIADEPTTALDVTIQAQILDLMQKLKEEMGMAIMLITHNLGLIAEMAQRVIVMYTGKIVESATVEELFENPLHPYTQALLQSTPWIGNKLATGTRQLKEIPGIVPSLLDLPQGCNFFPRCTRAGKDCGQVQPELKEVTPGHWVGCGSASSR